MGFKDAFLLSALGAFILAATGGCRQQEEPPPPLEIQAGQFTSAQACGRCHRDIYSAWQQSLHALAWTDPLFQASFQEAVELGGEQVRKLCLGCHTPSVVLSQDYAVAQDLTREGVNCDFCHSLTGTDLSQPDHPFALQVSNVKYGPVQQAASTGHAVAYSDFFNSSLLCAGCHEFEGPHGVQLLSTYSEWQEYTRRGGDQSCQQCHMPLVMAHIVDPKVKRIQGAFVNLHTMPGGHSLDQLSRSLRLRITQMESAPGGLRVRVNLTNTGAGHAVPTGMPTRKLFLRVEAETEDGQKFHQEKVYEKVVADAQGNEIRRDSRVFSQAVSILRDNRIAPHEERDEEFLLPVPAGENASVTVSLTYFYSPLNQAETEKRVQFASLTRKLVRRWQRSK